jgi:hypothetical protein
LRNPVSVPELSRFFGIVIAMYYTEHGPPHFHAAHGGRRASFDIDGTRVRGELAPTAMKLVLEWASLHRRELLENWDLAKARKAMKPIAPLD